MKLFSDSLANIAPAIVKAQSKMGNALKDSKNPFFKSSYADLNAVREAVLPAFNEEGISVLQPTVFIDGRKFVQTTLLHTSGEYYSALTEILSTKEGDAQAQGSGISYARRYGLQSLANVGAEDDDGNAASGNKSIRNAPAGNPANDHLRSAQGQAEAKAKREEAPKAETKPLEQAPAATTGSKSFRTNKPKAEEL